MQVILALDLGTTGNRVIAFSKGGDIIAKSYYEFPQLFPQPGWVEHNPWDIWQTTKQALLDVVAKVGVESVVALGITNQRETTILWNKRTGEPVFNAIVWQCRRTKGMCDELAEYSGLLKEKTGLFLDPYFSATKIKWVIDHVEGVKEHISKGDIVFGTVDSWVLWNLTGGKVHATEPSNASRTLCFNIHTVNFDNELLELFGVSRRILPEVKESGALFGYTTKDLVGREIPITGILGDQQASLFAQGGWQEGIIKNTYGTGLFLMTSTGKRIPGSGRLVNTIAWKMSGEVEYAMEGSIFVGGSSIQWLRDGLKILASAAETQSRAESLESNEGVYFVPALVGLGAPYWDPTARGLFIGVTRGTTVNHLARAALEAMAYQTNDVIEEMKRVMPELSLKRLRVDGGAAHNNFLMQFQADLLNVLVERPTLLETTASGAAGMAGITAGFWTKDEFMKARKIERVFTPNMDAKKRELYNQQWKKAVQRAMHWVED